jgi:DNA-binding response OmpR family regulator
MKIVVIEDDIEIVDSVSLTIRMVWPESNIISTGLGKEGIDLVSNEKPDINILDLGLPDISGFEVLKQIRLFSVVPILVLTVRAEEQNVVKALEMGADEYIVKPFRQMEFLARLRLLLRKHEPSYIKSRFSIGNWQFDHYNHKLIHNDKEVHLSNTESTILSHLFLNKRKVVTFSSLANILWEDEYPGCKDAIQVYIRRLRKKIEINASQPKIILTKTGIGYYLNDTD